MRLAALRAEEDVVVADVVAQRTSHRPHLCRHPDRWFDEREQRRRQQRLAGAGRHLDQRRGRSSRRNFSRFSIARFFLLGQRFRMSTGGIARRRLRRLDGRRW